MDHLPLFAQMKGAPCLVVGGGAVALRKVRLLLSAGARVTVNAPELTPDLLKLQGTRRISVVAGDWDPALVSAHLLVVAATSSRDVNRQVAATARAQFRLCNVVDDPVASSFILPSIIDRSPLIVAVSSGGRAPVLARRVRQQIERLLPLALADLASWAGRWRKTVQKRLPDVEPRRRFWERVFEGDLAEHVLSGRIRQADTAAATALDGTAEPIARPGIAWIVGAGPGDPELLTLRGLQCLQKADVVLHDRLVSPRLLEYARRDAEIVDVGKTGGGPATSQAAINRLLVEHVRAGRWVCRLKGGDPFVFGRGGEEAAVLAAAGLPFQVVPGITAASGCGAYAGIPLTHRGRAAAVTLVSATLADGGSPVWAEVARPGQTLVVYMAGQRLAAVTGVLQNNGWTADTPVAVVVAGTTAFQQVIRGTLENIARTAAGVGAPALLYVGEVVDLADALSGFTPDVSVVPDANPLPGLWGG